jgi:hypothetical protein
MRSGAPRGTDVELDLSAGGKARVIETDGNFVTLSSSRAFPPGSTLEGHGERGTYRVKVRGSRRVSPPDEPEIFRVEGRWVSLSRGQRQALLAHRPE